MWDHIDWLCAQGHQVVADNVMPPHVHRITAAVAWRLLVRWPQWAWHFLVADRVLIQETLLLGPLMWLKRWGKPRRVVFDFSDPVDTIGSGMRNRLQRLGFAAMTRGADHVIVENRAYLAELRSRGIEVSQFYGPVDADRYHAAAQQVATRDRDVVRIGWTGSPGTLSFIAPLFPVLERLAGKHRIELMLIGVTAVDFPFQQLSVQTLAWSEAEEFHLVPSFDLGLFALDGSDRSKRRGAGKLFIYMAAGVPFAASNAGIASDLMREAQIGFAADAPADWDSVLEQAISMTSARMDMAKRGSAHAARCMSYPVYRLKLAQALNISAAAQ